MPFLFLYERVNVFDMLDLLLSGCVDLLASKISDSSVDQVGPLCDNMRFAYPLHL